MIPTFISIGDSCSIKYQIDKIRGKQETLFFDWLMTDMNSVIYLLQHYNNIDDILHYNNITRDKDHPYHLCNSRIKIISLSNCISIHDMSVDYVDKDVFDFIEKYKRRLDRIIQHIKCDQLIYFIRKGYISETEKNEFIRSIKNINEKCRFKLINININREANTVINKGDHVLEINRTEKNDPKDWTMSYLNWEKIFEDIMM